MSDANKPHTRFSSSATMSVFGSIVRAGLSIAPGTGGIASLWGDWDISRRFARVEGWIEDVASTLEARRDMFDPSRLSDAEMQLLEHTLNCVSREHRDWKRKQFANLAASNWIHTERPYEERELFIRALDDFDLIHLKILHTLESRQALEPISATTLYEEVFAGNVSDENKFGVFMPAMNSLAAEYGLVRRRGQRDGKIMMNINPDGLTFHCLCLLSPAGERFVEFLDSSHGNS
jgi:hypothetical protein